MYDVRGEVGKIISRDDEYSISSRQGLDRMEQRAIREGWAVDPEKIPAIIERQLDLATGKVGGDDRPSTRASIRAADAVIKAMARQQKHEHRRQCDGDSQQ